MRGTCISTKFTPQAATTERTRNQLRESGIRKAETVSDRVLKIWTFSKRTKRTSSTPRASASGSPAPSIQDQAANPTPPTQTAEIRFSSSINRSKSPWSVGRGGRCIAPGSPGSKARPNCWIPFVIRFRYRSWTAASGTGRPARTERRKSSTSAAPMETSRYVTFRMLS